MGWSIFSKLKVAFAGVFGGGVLTTGGAIITAAIIGTNPVLQVLGVLGLGMVGISYIGEVATYAVEGMMG